MEISLNLFVIYVGCGVSVNAIILNRILDEIVDNELYFGFRNYFNTTRKDCVWRNAVRDRQLCSREVKIWLYSNGMEEQIDTRNANWLQESSGWSENKENIFFVHGYAGGDSSPPLLLMRDAFVQNGQYNFFMLDYGLVSRAPCYVSLVQNIKYVSNCLASYLNGFFRSGMQKKSVTCIGHSMGAHVCGLLRYYLGFRIQKIIGLDPALPFVSDPIRLSHRDAHTVHAIQTNAGYYGDLGSIGHVDICVNNGNMQPFCTNAQNPNLCSHLFALCFTAQSLFNVHNLRAKRCPHKVCPHYSIFQVPELLNNENINEIDGANSIGDRMPPKILLGLNILKSVRGSYCLSSLEPPFCSRNANVTGSPRCCSLAEMFQ